MRCKLLYAAKWLLSFICGGITALLLLAFILTFVVAFNKIGN
jgi:hypothetical protein